jgi:hypothetical protein
VFSCPLAFVYAEGPVEHRVYPLPAILLVVAQLRPELAATRNWLGGSVTNARCAALPPQATYVVVAVTGIAVLGYAALSCAGIFV